MATDWDLVRTLMNSAVDACEAFEALDIQDHERDASAPAGAQGATVFDALTSAWVLPEQLRYQIIRERHEAGADLSYVPEAARILVHMAQACAELIGAKETAPAAEACRKAAWWYSDHAVPLVREVIAQRRKSA